jgi:hypothetical protein
MLAGWIERSKVLGCFYACRLGVTFSSNKVTTHRSRSCAYSGSINLSKFLSSLNTTCQFEHNAHTETVHELKESYQGFQTGAH